MILAGILVTFAGWLLAFASLGLTESTGARLVLVLVGIAISVGGILGVLNRYYVKHALWRK
jgi:hypothetical protein